MMNNYEFLIESGIEGLRGIIGEECATCAAHGFCTSKEAEKLSCVDTRMEWLRLERDSWDDLFRDMERAFKAGEVSEKLLGRDSTVPNVTMTLTQGARDTIEMFYNRIRRLQHE